MPDHANPPDPPPSAPNVPHGLEVLRTYGEGFAGREAELAALHQAWNGGAVRVFVLHAQGGAGKTRVVAKWLTELRDAGWLGAGRVFVHSFYSQGNDQHRNASSELFFEQALAHFGHPGPPLTDPTEKGRTLAGLLIEQHGLLVLDGIEPLQQPPAFDQGRLKDPALQTLLVTLAAGRIGAPTGRGLCVVTSRQSVVELQDKTGRTVLQQELDRLDAAAGVALLQQLAVRGPERELQEAVEDAHGHAYSLMLLGAYLRNATDHHDIRRRGEVVLLDEDAEHGDHARKMFAAYMRHLGEDSPEVAVLRLLGFFDRAAERDLLDVLRAREGFVYEWPQEGEETNRRPQPKLIEDSLTEVTAPLLDLPKPQLLRALNRLRDLGLIDFTEPDSPALDAHPLLRECFAKQVQLQYPAAWQAGHRRLFEHLGGKALYWPEGIQGLQPLYQAVAHGCLAGLHQQVCDNVYVTRILRDTESDGFYSQRKLGAIGAEMGALACFFTEPWTTLVPNLAPVASARVCNEAAFCLRTLGRLDEAVRLLKTAQDILVQEEDWKRAAVVASNLNELKLMRGEIAEAIAAGEQSVVYADRSENPFRQMLTRAVLADALHQAGHRERSRMLFEGAESYQAAWKPESPRLHSTQGFRYCNFLLADAERILWRHWLGAEPEATEMLATATATCDAISERAAYGLKIAIAKNFLLDIALNHLTLARATLYKSQLALDHHHITAATDGLRASGRMDHLPRSLLTRASLRCFSGNEPGARADLDEAGEIAKRGPMPLFQADIQLTRARLFRNRVALEDARRLIEKHGYHRRDEELADAEAAARTWLHPPTPFPIALPPAGIEGATTPSTDTDEQSEDSMADQVFISYSHCDKKFMEELQTHLKPYLRSGTITSWSDKQIAAGSQWFDEIQGGMSKASAAVLLVSPDFLASDFIHEHELGPLLKEAKSGGVKILWVPLRPSAYEKTPLKDYQAVSSPDKPLAQMSKPERDNAWVEICKKIERAVASSRNSVAVPGTVSTPAVTSSVPPRIGGSAVKVWQEKLAFLQEEEAIASDPDQKFRLRKLIEEARQKIRELGGQA